ncbi:two-component system sensor histidine kinase DesK [Labedaea rhizosphaerae]|uniref:Two-component system sensor histidine kinase DesK n=1 Tax=Labedaea rhizosphaerae TaxID=598644 RepID=A0A4R6SAQ1_LABRH|nr:two-component system sensor histidine kinase DesK [Labedaea rhizosphaerae]
MLPVAFLVALLVARGADTTAHKTAWYLPFLLAVFVLPLWYAGGWARGPWRRVPLALLAAQAVVTYVPFAVFGNQWVGGASGLLMGMVLLVLPSPGSWVVAASLLGVEALLWNGVVGVPYLPAISGGLWAVDAAVNNALGLFGLVRLSRVVGELARTQDELADAAVLRERRRTSEQLATAIEGRIQEVAKHARAALRWLSTTEEDARGEVTAAGRIARAALAEGRQLRAHDPVEPLRRSEPGGVPGPLLTKGVLATVLAMFVLVNMLNVFAPTDAPGSGHQVSAPVVVLAIVVSVGIPLLQWRHSGAQHGGERPRHWPLTLALLAVLTYAQFPAMEAAGLIFLAWLAGSVLLLVRGPWRWFWFVLVATSLPVLTWLRWPAVIRDSITTTWLLYATSIGIAFGLMTYGLSLLAGLADRLDERREQLAALATVRERLRLAQDTHDLLGLGMSTLALKTDLVGELIGRDNQLAARELSEVVRLCSAVQDDASRIAAERPELSLAAEFTAAEEVLAASGIDVFTERAPVPLAADADAALAIVLREAVTNILRHSAAQRCAITLAGADGFVRLRVSNDGATPAHDRRGRGLANMRDRVAALGGELATKAGGGTFVVVAELPG